LPPDADKVKKNLNDNMMPLITSAMEKRRGQSHQKFAEGRQ